MRLFLLLLCLWMPGAVMAELGSLMLRPQGPHPPCGGGSPRQPIHRRGEGKLSCAISCTHGACAGRCTAAGREFCGGSLRHVIGRAESPRAGYDDVQHGARIKPRKRPTDMTIGEIYD